MARARDKLEKSGLHFLMVRLPAADLEVAAELIRRGCFRYSDLLKLHEALAEFSEKAELRAVISFYLQGGRLAPQPAWVAALANSERQIAIHAVVNAGMSDAELERLEKLLKLQRGDHLLRQVQVAIELEQNRRRTGGKRSSRNRVTTGS